MPGPCCALSLIQNVLMPKTNYALRLSSEIFHFCLDSQKKCLMYAKMCETSNILFFPPQNILGTCLSLKAQDACQVRFIQTVQEYLGNIRILGVP